MSRQPSASGNDLICSSIPGDPELCSSTSREGVAVRRTQVRSSFLGSTSTCRSRPWCPSGHHCERIWRGHGAQGQGIQKMGLKKHRIGMQHIQINKTLQYQTLAHLRHITLRAMPHSLQKIMSLGHSHASESLASRAWRKISGIADRARWRSGVVFVTFPCLFPLHIATTDTHSSECAQICGESLGRCSPWWCRPTLDHFGAAG